MKKNLLGTSALIGAAALFAGAANAAETPKITLGGFSNFEGGFESSNDQKPADGLRPGAFRTDNVITVRVAGKSDMGLGYGAGIDLEADTSENADSSGVNAERTFVYVDGKWGKLQGGSDLGVAKTMKVDASSIARATGGIDGDFTYFATAPSHVVSGINEAAVIATPDLALDYGDAYFGSSSYGDESTQAANKISYYTPRFSGFQAGVSYVPDSSSKGQVISRTNNNNGGASSPAIVKNVLVGALNYEGKFSNVGVAVGATGEYGAAVQDLTAGNEVNDLRTYQFGAKVDYMGFSLAGSYGNYGDSLRLKSDTNDSSNYFWTVGAAYETGPFGASVTYLKSQFDLGASNGNNTFSNVSVGVDYKLAAGLTPYAEVNFVDNNQSEIVNTGLDNKSTVFVLGTQLAF